MDNETLKNNLLNEIWKLQTGVYSKADIERFDPAITGCGVSVFALLGRFHDIGPKLLAVLTKELVEEGSLSAIDSDVHGLPSFRANETVTQRGERLLTESLSKYEVKMVYNIV